jgi:hypothetical protein
MFETLFSPPKLLLSAKFTVVSAKIVAYNWRKNMPIRQNPASIREKHTPIRQDPASIREKHTPIRQNPASIRQLMFSAQIHSTTGKNPKKRVPLTHYFYKI